MLSISRVVAVIVACTTFEAAVASQAIRRLAEEPVGSIVAWDRDLPGTPALAGWVECDGQVIMDPESPYFGQATPDLNGERRFLRGGGSSGVFQGDTIPSHTHAVTHGAEVLDSGSAYHKCHGDCSGCLAGFNHTSDLTVLDPVNDGHGSPRTGEETRPVNTSVVWILKPRTSLPMPVGSIVGWHRDFGGGLRSEPGWAKCDGQILQDSLSPLDGQMLPDLNGEGRFLRGDVVSGVPQPDSFQGHRHLSHEYSVNVFGGCDLSNVPFVENFFTPITIGSVIGANTDHETRPINMSVVWILKTRADARVPSGGIVGVHEDFPNTPRLPPAWHRCQGQPIGRPYWDCIPDLNGPGRFLRGGLISGVEQSDAIQGHAHAFDGPAPSYIDASAAVWGGAVNPPFQLWDDASAFIEVREPSSDTVNGTPRVGQQARPRCMWVVWAIYLPVEFYGKLR